MDLPGARDGARLETPRTRARPLGAADRGGSPHRPHEPDRRGGGRGMRESPAWPRHAGKDAGGLVGPSGRSGLGHGGDHLDAGAVARRLAGRDRGAGADVVDAGKP